MALIRTLQIFVHRWFHVLSIQWTRREKIFSIWAHFVYQYILQEIMFSDRCLLMISLFYVSDKFIFAILMNNNTSDGFGLVDWDNEVEKVVGFVVVDAKTGRFTICGTVEMIGFFVGFGFVRVGSFSHCVGLGFVIKFGWVVTCHCVVCASWFHKPSFRIWCNKICLFRKINSDVMLSKITN